MCQDASACQTHRYVVRLQLAACEEGSGGEFACEDGEVCVHRGRGRMGVRCCFTTATPTTWKNSDITDVHLIDSAAQLFTSRGPDRPRKAREQILCRPLGIVLLVCVVLGGRRGVVDVCTAVGRGTMTFTYCIGVDEHLLPVGHFV